MTCVLVLSIPENRISSIQGRRGLGGMGTGSAAQLSPPLPVYICLFNAFGVEITSKEKEGRGNRSLSID